jgi:hypothetical protein
VNESTAANFGGACKYSEGNRLEQSTKPAHVIPEQIAFASPGRGVCYYDVGSRAQRHSGSKLLSSEVEQ